MKFITFRLNESTLNTHTPSPTPPTTPPCLNSRFPRGETLNPFHTFPRTPDGVRILPCSPHSTKSCTPDGVPFRVKIPVHCSLSQAGHRAAGHHNATNWHSPALSLPHQKQQRYGRKENHHPRRLQCRAVQKRHPVLFRGRHHYGMDVGPRLRAAISVLSGGRRLRPAVGGVSAGVGLARQNDHLPERRILGIIFEMFGRRSQPDMVQKPSQRPYRPRHQGSTARNRRKVSNHRGPLVRKRGGPLSLG